MLRSDRELADFLKMSLKSQCENIDCSNQIDYVESNLCGVEEAQDIYKRVNDILCSYKEILKENAENIGELGEYFFDIDRYMGERG